MHVATVTCRFDPALGAFDDGPLRALTRDKVVVSVKDHFFTVGDLPHLAFVVVYRLVTPSALDGSSGRLEAQRAASLQGQVPPSGTFAAPAHGAGVALGGAGGAGPRSRSQTDDLRAGLPADARARFDLLRDWRNRTAQDEAVPAYAVLTNRQLVQVATLAPATRAALERVEGLGKKKADRYAPAVLAILTGQPPAPRGPTPAATPSPSPSPSPSPVATGACASTSTPPPSAVPSLELAVRSEGTGEERPDLDALRGPSAPSACDVSSSTTSAP